MPAHAVSPTQPEVASSTSPLAVSAARSGGDLAGVEVDERHGAARREPDPAGAQPGELAQQRRPELAERRERRQRHAAVALRDRARAERAGAHGARRRLQREPERRGDRARAARRLRQAPGVAAGVHEGLGGAHSDVHRAGAVALEVELAPVERDAEAAAAAGDDRDIRADLAARAGAVVGEKAEAAGQLAQRGARADPVVEPRGDVVDIVEGAGCAAGQRAGEHVARAIVRHGRQQPAAAQAGREVGTDRVAGAQPAHLQVRPCGDVEQAVAELARRPRRG